MSRLRVASLNDRRISVPLQLLLLGVLLGSLGWAVRDVWPDAAPRLRQRRSGRALDLAARARGATTSSSCSAGIWILRAFGIRLPYRFALQAEMLSMLAKYIPGGVWTPAARVVALRRFGYTDTPIVLASIALEAGLSALAGVIVLLASLPLVGVVDAPFELLIPFALAVGRARPPSCLPARRVAAAAARSARGRCLLCATGRRSRCLRSIR